MPNIPDADVVSEVAVPAHRAVVPWVPPKERREVKEAEVRAQQQTALQDQRTAAEIRVAEAREAHARAQTAAMKLIAKTLERWLALSEDPDFASGLGPLDPNVLLKLAEWATKNHRLDNGQSTENVQHAVSGAVNHVMRRPDFSKLTQEQRNQWRELAVLAGAGDVPE